MINSLAIATSKPGTIKITGKIKGLLDPGSLSSGLCTLFIQHTSASLLIQENADSSARRELENRIARIAPENDALYAHTTEGPDDMPAHIKSLLTQTHLSIPIVNGRFVLGTWQGIFLFEHRKGRHVRNVVVHCVFDS